MSIQLSRAIVRRHYAKHLSGVNIQQRIRYAFIEMPGWMDIRPLGRGVLMLPSCPCCKKVVSVKPMSPSFKEAAHWKNGWPCSDLCLAALYFDDVKVSKKVLQLWRQRNVHRLFLGDNI